MKPVKLTVNGRSIVETVEPRTHLADFLRERLTLTATHLRCEQGACGACTLLIDGQPARSCINYVVLCDGAEVTTLEGLEDDPVIAALRHAFSVDHGLQCGYCTPGMLVTARDIVARVPDADDERIRLELSGNLCRCTGYVGIVRAIRRVLDQRRNGELVIQAANVAGSIGPVGARTAQPQQPGTPQIAPAPASAAASGFSTLRAVLGLAGRQPNINVRQAFTVSRPPEEVWTFLSDTARVIHCLPGASLGAKLSDEHVEGAVRIKLGPITANFTGEARIERDEATHRGTILGNGKDRMGSSHASGELEYAVEPAPEGARVLIAVRALLTGPLAQFSRSGIVEELVARIATAFAQNLETQLRGDCAGSASADESTLPVGSLVWQVIVGRLKAVAGRVLGKRGI